MKANTGRRPRVLVADGAESTRMKIGSALRTAGCEVATAVDAEDALEQLQNGQFTLLILDLNIRRVDRTDGIDDIDGMGILHQVVARYPDTQVVSIMADSSVETAVGAMKLGALDFIQKPITPQQIQTLVERALSLRQRDASQTDDYGLHLERTRRSIGERHFEAANQHLRRAIACDPSRPDAFNLLGILHDLQGDHHAALIHYRVALDLDPTYDPARSNLTRATTWSGDTPTGYDWG